MSDRDEIQKVFIFGIDGATFNLMNPWMEKGALPTLSSLTENGTASVCYSTIPPVSCPAWKSFSTGMNPGKLGVFDLVCRSPDTYTLRPVRADMIGVPDFWDILSANGYSVGVFNVPATYPPRPVNGFIIPGMLSDPEAPDFTYPSGLKAEIEKVLGTPYQIDVELKGSFDPDVWLENQHAVTELQVEAIKYLTEHKEWDIFVAVLYEVDRVQHRFWHCMDRDYPGFQPSHLEHVIENSYKRMDTFLREILNTLGDDTIIVVMSDHGFGPVRGYFRLNQWLLSKGYLALDKQSMKAFFENVAQQHLGKKPPEVASPLNAIGGPYKIEWSNTEAFAVRTGNLYLNVRGREPQGAVEMGKEYEEVRNKLTEDLSNLVHPTTKKQLKVTIYKKEDIYSGRYFLNAPDLLVSIEDYEYWIEQGFGPMWTGLDGKGGFPTGKHRMDGIFIASGRNITEGQRIDPISLVDIAPTVLHILKVKISQDMDGNVVFPLFKVGSDPVSREVDISREIQADMHPEASSKDDEKVLKRLRDLGYLG